MSNGKSVFVPFGRIPVVMNSTKCKTAGGSINGATDLVSELIVTQ